MSETTVGWQVLDPDGNVVDSGEVSIAELTLQMIENMEGA